ncbi:MAG: RNA polymerase sigma-54 factor [Candidatus Omnitrophota bacterium]|nr:MAG: RNA polymerase sigma-54 factor [Candidatus Omnitrophota bacterium]
MFKQQLVQKQTQKMIMSIKMQQSMQILQMPVLELDQLIAEEIATNPALEEKVIQVENTKENARECTSAQETQDSANIDPVANTDEQDINAELQWLNNDDIWAHSFTDKSKISRELEKYNFQQALIIGTQTLQDDLLQQFRLSNNKPEDLQIAEQIIGNIDDNGYLSCSIEEISQTLHCTKELVAKILEQVQSLEPAGIGARDLKECLLIQLKSKGRGNSPESLIISNFLTELATRKYTKISKALKISLSQVKKYALKISDLNPKPCKNFSLPALRIIPDIFLEKTPGGYEITINSKHLQRLCISRLYKKILKNKSCSKEAIQFIRKKLASAQDLLNGLSLREQTLKKVTKCIIKQQPDFITHGISKLKPLTLREIAEKIHIHTSTVSRAISNKYIQTPYGTFAIKTFFSQAIFCEGEELSNRKIKLAVDELIKTEDSKKPLSDQKIVKLLAVKKMQISRRTVTKYRNALKIPAASLRKR